MKVTILGCGSSSGTPPIGKDFPANPKNIRSRASIFIEGTKTNILIDTSPDLRAQALANKINRVDAVIYTHAHADHVHGIDDIKSFNYLQNSAIPIYSNEATIKELKERFAYCFMPHKIQAGYFKASLEPNVIIPNNKFQIGEFEILVFRQMHTKNMDSLGVRIGNFVYSTDVKTIPQESEPYLQNMDLWVVDCLKKVEAPTHSDLDQTLGWIKKYKPKQAVLTHLSYEMDYDNLKETLPSSVEPAYDGMVLEI